MKATVWRFDAPGDSSVLYRQTETLPEPAAGQVLLRHTVIGLNFVDTYFRAGLYPTDLPGRLGSEAVGIVERVGAGVTRVGVGDRVVYATGPLGAYSEARIMPQTHLVKLPDGISDEAAAAIFLKGLTAEYLIRRTHRVREGETVLFHAAAGGVGLIAGQWLHHLGACTIGTAGSQRKCDLASRHGFDHAIDYSSEDVAARVMDLTDGKGVPIVYDGIGRATFDISISCLSPRGMLVSFGNASGPVPPIAPAVLSPKSLYLTRPTLNGYSSTPESLDRAALDLFEVVQNGAVEPVIGQRFHFHAIAEAHRALESRSTVGSTVISF